MKLSEIKPVPHATKRPKIVGRGPGSGHGKTSTRGNKGQNARTGGGVRLGFTGGQTPLVQTIPHRGFNHPKKIKVEIINVGSLSRFSENTTVTPEELKKMGLTKKSTFVKILGGGELKIKLVVRAHAFSDQARQKIESAGGRMEVL
jgi:large subunit ribosomal protein L15